jgi:hypothetical protein
MQVLIQLAYFGGLEDSVLVKAIFPLFSTDESLVKGETLSTRTTLSLDWMDTFLPTP